MSERAAGSWGYTPQNDGVTMVIPNDLAGAVGDLITDPEAFFAAIVASASVPRLVPVVPETELYAAWVDPEEIIAVQEGREDRGLLVYLRGGGVVELPLRPQDLFERLTPKPVGPPD